MKLSSNFCVASCFTGVLKEADGVGCLYGVENPPGFALVWLETSGIGDNSKDGFTLLNGETKLDGIKRELFALDSCIFLEEGQACTARKAGRSLSRCGKAGSGMPSGGNGVDCSGAVLRGLIQVLSVEWRSSQDSAERVSTEKAMVMSSLISTQCATFARDLLAATNEKDKSHSEGHRCRKCMHVGGGTRVQGGTDPTHTGDSCL